MEASSPLSSVRDDNDYTNGMTPAKAPVCRLEAVQTDRTPCAGQALLPNNSAPESIAQATLKEHEPIVSPQEKDTAVEAPADSTGRPDARSPQAQISPMPSSDTTNKLVLAPPATPASAASIPAQPDQQLETAEPGPPATARARTTSQTPTSKSPRGREHATQPSPTTPTMDEINEISLASAASEPNGADHADNADSAAAMAKDAARTTTRSGRRVVQPKKVQDATPPPTVSTKAKPKATRTARAKATKAANEAASPAVTPAVMRRRKAQAARWQTDFLLSSARSPLADIDLRSLLLRPATWDALSREDQADVLALFPSMDNVSNPGTDGARPDVSSLISDNNFRHDCARYTSDLQSGYFERAWLAEAFEAHMMRSQGMFDEYVVDEFEQAWGVTVPESLRGSSTAPMEPGQEARAETADTSPQESPPLPAPTEQAAVDVRPPSANGDQTNGVSDVSANDNSPHGSISAPNAEGCATTLATAESIPCPDSGPVSAAPFSLSLGSPIVSENEADKASTMNGSGPPDEIKAALLGDDGGAAVDSEPVPGGRKTVSPKAKNAAGKRKAAAAPAQRGRKKKAAPR